MASDFVRNIKDVRNIDILSPNITTENDLISTSDGEVYVVTNKGYRKITGVETKEIKQLKTDVSNVKIQADTNTLNISNLTDDIETNTSDIETLNTSTDNNTSEIETLKTTTDNNTSEIETLKTTSDNNTSEIDTLKTSTDNNTSEISDLKIAVNNFKVLLFEGSAGETSEIITLNQSYKDFTELKIKIKRTGGNEILNFDAEDVGGLSINITNIYNDNSEMKLYEMIINKNSSTELEITSQRSNTVTEPKPTDDSGITILKIWGVK